MFRISAFLTTLLSTMPAVACMVVEVMAPDEAAPEALNRERAQWEAQFRSSSVVFEATVLTEHVANDHALYALQPRSAWKDDGQQLVRAYVPTVPCQQVQLQSGERYVIFGLRRDLPATHAGVPIQVTLAVPIGRETQANQPPGAVERHPRIQAFLEGKSVVPVKLVP